MGIADPFHLRTGFCTCLCAVFAAGGKAAALGKICGVWHQTRDRLETVASLFDVGKGAEQSLCIRMERALKYVLQGSVLNDLTGIYYGYLIACLLYTSRCV